VFDLWRAESVGDRRPQRRPWWWLDQRHVKGRQGLQHGRADQAWDLAAAVAESVHKARAELAVGARGCGCHDLDTPSKSSTNVLRFGHALDVAAFDAWAETHAVLPADRAYLAALRRGQPVRRLRATHRAGPVRFPSRKMGVVVQCRSRLDGLPLAYELEHDAAVLEYYDLPTTLHLHYTARSGKRAAVEMIPDFLVMPRRRRRVRRVPLGRRTRGPGRVCPGAV